MTGGVAGGARFLGLAVAGDLFGRDRLGRRLETFDLGPFEQPVDADLDAGQLVAFFGSDEGKGNPLASHAAGAADAVDVIVAELGDIEVDDVRDAGHVDAAADDVGGDQALHLTFAELEHDPVAGRLGQVAVDAGDRLDLVGQAALHLVGAALRAAKDDRLLGVFALEQPDQQLEFALRVDREVELLDCLDRDVLGRKVQHLGIVHVTAGEPLDRWRHRGAEE